MLRDWFIKILLPSLVFYFILKEINRNILLYEISVVLVTDSAHALHVFVVGVALLEFYLFSFTLDAFSRLLPFHCGWDHVATFVRVSGSPLLLLACEKNIFLFVLFYDIHENILESTIADSPAL